MNRSDISRRGWLVPRMVGFANFTIHSTHKSKPFPVARLTRALSRLRSVALGHDRPVLESARKTGFNCELAGLVFVWFETWSDATPHAVGSEVWMSIKRGDPLSNGTSQTDITFSAASTFAAAVVYRSRCFAPRFSRVARARTLLRRFGHRSDSTCAVTDAPAMLDSCGHHARLRLADLLERWWLTGQLSG